VGKLSKAKHLSLTLLDLSKIVVLVQIVAEAALVESGAEAEETAVVSEESFVAIATAASTIVNQIDLNSGL